MGHVDLAAYKNELQLGHPHLSAISKSRGIGLQKRVHRYQLDELNPPLMAQLTLE